MRALKADFSDVRLLPVIGADERFYSSAARNIVLVALRSER